VRADAFDLFFGRLSVEGEVAIIGPLALEVRPMWIWGSPLTAELDKSGFAISGGVVIYPGGKALQGFWLKGIFGYETFTATVSNLRNNVSQEGSVSSPVFGMMLGSSNLFSRSGGFVISGGAGLGIATSDPVVVGDGFAVPEYHFYEAADKIKLLTSLAIGVAF
jgi:hypothetical protein